MARLIRLATLVLCVLIAHAAYGATYYVDCAGGNDSNNGTSKTTSWLHAPGMVGFSATYTHAAGDHFVFKGGTTCPVGFLPLTIGYSGSAGNYDVYGATDKSWYTGGSWARVIFNGGGTGPVGYNMVEPNGKSYWQLDSIEFYNQGIPNTGVGRGFLGSLGTTSHDITVNNSYIHGWVIIGGCVSGSGGKIGGSTTGTGVHQIYSNNIFDGSDVVGKGTGLIGEFLSLAASDSATEVYGNTVHDVVNGVVGPGGFKIHDNTFYNINASCDTSGGDHGNVIELGGSAQIYNNVIHDSGGGSIIIFSNPSNGTTDYIYNNVFYNNTANDITIETHSACCTTGTENIINNTFEQPSTRTIIRVNLSGNSLGTLNAINNHFINGSSTSFTGAVCYNQRGVCDPITTVNNTTNVMMTTTTATTQGYVTSNRFAPTSGTNSTVGAGTNETSLCSTIAPLCSDILAVARPSGGAWDAGAYEGPHSTSSQPSAPSQLTAVVQ